MPKDPELSRWKLTEAAKAKPRKKLSVSDPLEIPDAPPPSPEPEPEPLVIQAPGDAPDGLEPFPTEGWFPMGETQFAWTVRQLGDLRGDVDVLSGVSGPVAGVDVTNIFTTNQTIEMTDLTSTVIPLLIDINNNATGVSYPLRLAHRYSGGVGPVGLGVGIDLQVESGTEGVKNSIAAFEAQSTVNTDGAMTGEAGINVVVAGDPERVMTFGHQHIRNHFQPEAATTHGLFELGDAAFVGDADGTYYTARAEAGFTGDFVNFQIGGASIFRVDEAGTIYVNGSEFTGGGGVTVPLTLTLDDTGSNTVGYPLILQHTHSAGAGATGIATGIRFDMETSSGGTISTFGSLQYEALNAGVGNLTTAVRFNVKDNNADVEGFRIGNNYAGVFHAPAAATDRSLMLIGAAGFTGHAQGTLYGAAQDAGFAGDMINLQVGSRPRLVQSGAGAATITVHDSAETGPTAALQIEHRIDTVDTPAVGMGVGLELRADDAGKTVRTFAKIEAEGRDLTANAVDSDLVLYMSIGGVQTEGLRLRSATGDVRVIERIMAQAGLGVGNSAAATTPGTVTKKMEVFDAFTGASLGFVAIYDGIS